MKKKYLLPVAVVLCVLLGSIAMLFAANYVTTRIFGQGITGLLTEGGAAALETVTGILGGHLPGGKDSLDTAIEAEDSPCMSVSITSADGTADPSRVTMKCVRKNADGTLSPVRQILGTGTASGRFALADMEPGASYQIHLYYDGEPIKTLILDAPAEQKGKKDLQPVTIDLSLACLEITVADRNNRPVSGAAVEVQALDEENGIAGITRRISAPNNEADAPVYRIPVAPGAYSITILGTNIQDTVTAVSQVTLTYTMDPDLTAYGDIVRQYESQYGTLEFSPADGASCYTGVFLLELADFDDNGIEELIIGYSVPCPEDAYCTWPYLDVWSLEKGQPVPVYKGASIRQEGMGKHCAFTQWNGRYYLLTGWEGSDTCTLKLSSLKDGVFLTDITLFCGERFDRFSHLINQAEVNAETFQQALAEVHAGEPYYYSSSAQAGCFSGRIDDDTSYTAEDLRSQLAAVKEQLGITEEPTDTDLSVYASVVQQYEETYGTIGYSVYYQDQKNQTGETDLLTGVCLLWPIDFDGDSRSELMIGYGKVTEENTGLIQLYADVWGVDEDTPVLLYSGATIPGDLQNYISCKTLDGVYYLVDGVARKGFAQLNYYGLEDGSFKRKYTLEANFLNNPTYTKNAIRIPVKEYQDFILNDVLSREVLLRNSDQLKEYEDEITAMHRRMGLP